MLRRNSKRFFSFASATTCFPYSTEMGAKNFLFTRSYQTTLIPYSNNEDTPLHMALRSYNIREEVNKLITKIGIDAAGKMAIQMNNFGELPIDVIEESKLDYDEKGETLVVLHNLMKKNNLKKLAEPITLDAVFKKYKPAPGSALHENLTIACNIANEVRTLIPESFSHPQTNYYNQQEKIHLSQLTVELRNEVNRSSASDSIKKKMMGDLALKRGIGNCREFSCATVNLLNEYYPKKQSYICNLENGDHVFVVVGCSAKSHPKNGLVKNLKWNNDVALCDAWGGMVMTSHDARELMDHRAYTLDNFTYLNVTCPVNENYHILTPDKQDIYHSQLNRLGLFNQQKVASASDYEKLRHLPRFPVTSN